MESSICAVLLIFVNVAIWVILSLIPRLKNKNKVFLVLSFISLLVFLTVREPYSDMIAYEKYFKTINTDSFEVVFINRWEILFKVLLFIIRLITDDTHVMMGIIALITLTGPFLFIKRYSKNYLLSIVMFIALGSFYLQFYILRQAIALSIFLAFFYLISEKKLLKYCFAIVVAALFHKTALVLLFLYPIINIPPSKIKNVIIATITILALIFSPMISNLLMSDFYSEYTDRVSSGLGIELFLFYVCMYVVYFIFKQRSRVKENGEVTKTSMFTIVMQFFTVQNNAFSRIASYTRDSFCVLIPNLTDELAGKNKLLFSIIVIGVCIGFILATGAFSWYVVI